jgi:molybdopterin-guanine dinucleotide biosynthesis protein A
MRVVAGAVLAGGASRRMGRPKEGLPLRDGRVMLAHTLEALRGACGRVAVVGACAGASLEHEPAVHHVRDERPGEGPLGGLVSLLASGLASGYLLAACDQPLLTPALLRRLLGGDPARACFFRTPDGRQLDPFPGYFPAALLPAARADFDAGQRSMRRFTAAQDPQWINLAPHEMGLLLDLDTPEEAAAFIAAS